MEEILTKQHFIELSDRVQTTIRGRGWFDRHGYESVMLFLRVALFAGAFSLFALPSWPARIVGMILLSYAYTAIAITGTHETSHLSYVKSKFFNKAWAYFFSDFWSAQSHLWWHYRHVQVHHLYPNVNDREPKSFYFPWINRYVYFFIIPYLVVFWLIAHSIKYLWKKWANLAMYLVAMVLGWAFHAFLFTTIGFSWFVSFALVLLMRSLLAPVFIHLAVFNHIGLDNPREVLPWMPRQDLTTRNLKPSFLLNIMGGNAFLECHLEHHLFPSLSNHMLGKIRPIVRTFMQEKGYAYREETYFSCLRNCLRHYHEIFENKPKSVW
jgi:fatty acid desaturase 6